jgi:hypothetical protein
MIFCLLHQPSFRRHLDGGAALSKSAQAHVNRCPRCRAMLQSHLAIIRHLSAMNDESLATPSFLHARVMNGVRQAAPQKDKQRMLPQWGIAALGCAAVLALALLFVPRNSPMRSASWPDIHSDIAFKTTLPANPLETEIENLRMDTVNATKALAASFMLQQDSEK